MSNRATGQANRQRRGLAALGAARRRGPLVGASAGAALPMLAVLSVLETAADLARLGRAVPTADPEEDGRWRRLIVCVNALSQAIVDDLKSGGDAASWRLYRAVSATQHREPPK